MKLTKYYQLYSSILKLGLPLLLGQLGNITVSFADNIMVGHYSTEALASASFVNNVFNIAIFACMGFSYGLTPLVGAMFVKNENTDIGATVRRALWVNTIFTLIVMLIMFVAYFFIPYMGQPEELLPLIKPYYLICWAGLLPMCIFNVLAQWSFGINNTTLPTWIILAGNVLNILGNYILIFGHFGAPELGLIGAGWSTLASRIFCPVVIFIFFYYKHGLPYLDGFRHSVGKGISTKTIAITGFPVAMTMLFETASFSGSAVMAGWLGALSLAAFQIVVISGQLGFCIYYSLAGAMAIKVSHAAGHEDGKGMRRCAWAGYHICLAAMFCACVAFLGFGNYIMSWFTNDPEVLSLAVTMLIPMALYQFGDATQITFANALRGTSKVSPMLWIAFISYVVIGLPATYFIAFPCGLGLFGIILSFTLCLGIAGIFYFIYFMRASKPIKKDAL